MEKKLSYISIFIVAVLQFVVITPVAYLGMNSLFTADVIVIDLFFFVGSPLVKAISFSLLSVLAYNTLTFRKRLSNFANDYEAEFI
ncbi:hypothetical protein AB6E94_19455 [Vibrio lentus]|uniref:hypothetical protein n=1 Tax=Vibrio splendidus TaxID=29497 RepID=UPI000C82642E|nr:hypothetical protein [Vibrio splendidus]PMG17880.1 hypothetical protein BCU98_00675 [Vibrio splendidus]